EPDDQPEDQPEQQRQHVSTSVGAPAVRAPPPPLYSRPGTAEGRAGHASRSRCPQYSPAPSPGGQANRAEPVCWTYSIIASLFARPRWIGTNWAPGLRTKQMKHRPASKWTFVSAPSAKL